MVVAGTPLTAALSSCETFAGDVPYFRASTGFTFTVCSRSSKYQLRRTSVMPFTPSSCFMARFASRSSMSGSGPLMTMSMGAFVVAMGVAPNSLMR